MPIGEESPVERSAHAKPHLLFRQAILNHIGKCSLHGGHGKSATTGDLMGPELFGMEF